MADAQTIREALERLYRGAMSNAEEWGNSEDAVEADAAIVRTALATPEPAEPREETKNG